jgi:hypothetical protein
MPVRIRCPTKYLPNFRALLRYTTIKEFIVKNYGYANRFISYRISYIPNFILLVICTSRCSESATALPVHSLARCRTYLVALPYASSSSSALQFICINQLIHISPEENVKSLKSGEWGGSMPSSPVNSTISIAQIQVFCYLSRRSAVVF